jgi:hypothetical protein
MQLRVTLGHRLELTESPLSWAAFSALSICSFVMWRKTLKGAVPDESSALFLQVSKVICAHSPCPEVITCPCLNARRWDGWGSKQNACDCYHVCHHDVKYSPSLTKDEINKLKFWNRGTGLCDYEVYTSTFTNQWVRVLLLFKVVTEFHTQPLRRSLNYCCISVIGMWPEALTEIVRMSTSLGREF